MATRKPKFLTFTRREPSADDLDDAEVECDLRRAHRYFKRGELVPETIWKSANSLLAERSRKLSFSTKQPYVAAMKETLRRFPFLRLGVGPYLYDSEFADVQFTDLEAQHDDNAA